MIGSIVRSVGAVIAGLVAAMFFIVGTEAVWAVVYPPAPGVDLHDIEACKAHIAQLPADAFVIAAVGWGLAVLAGSWVATRLGAGRHPAHGIVVSGSGDRVFVTNVFANTVSVIDPMNRKVLRNIAVGAGPGGVTYAVTK